MKTPPTIRDLYPDYTDEQLAEAEDNIGRYIELVLRIGERIIKEKGYDEFVRMIEEGKSRPSI